MTDELKDNIESQIGNLIRKANQTRDFHSVLAQEAEKWQQRVSTYIVVGSAVSTLTIFAHFTHLSNALGLPEGIFPFLVGVLSASVFISQQFMQHKRWSQKSKDHRVSVDLWGQWMRRADSFLKTQLRHSDSNHAKELANDLNDDYLDVMGNAVQIPDDRFLQLKARFREKLWISKELDKDTGESVRKLRKRFRRH